jgi:hypothetical protein
MPQGTSSAVVYHETLHTMTSDGWNHRVGKGPTNEAMTEYLTRKAGYFETGTGFGTKAYEGGQRLLDEYIKENPAREDALAKAYFTGDFSDLDRLETLPAPAQSWKKPFDSRIALWEKQMENKLGGGTTYDDEQILLDQAKAKATAKPAAKPPGHGH